MASKLFSFYEKAPSVPTLRKMLRESAAAGKTQVIFERGEQQSEFYLLDSGRWMHHGNGLLNAGYKLANILDSEWFAAMRAGTEFKL